MSKDRLSKHRPVSELNGKKWRRHLDEDWQGSFHFSLGECVYMC